MAAEQEVDLEAEQNEQEVQAPQAHDNEMYWTTAENWGDHLIISEDTEIKREPQREKIKFLTAEWSLKQKEEIHLSR